MPKTVASPSPVPLPTSLVVKNGSKTRAITSGGMPVPVSLTRRRTQRATPCSSSLSTASVATINCPPCGMASRALTARFNITCSIIEGSASMAGASGACSATSEMFSPINRSSIRLIVVTVSPREMTLRCNTWRRLKVSNCFVKLAARSVVVNS